MAVADTTRPVLTSLSFPAVVDVTSGGQYINFTAGASDEGLGVSHIYVNFNKSWQNQSSNQSYFYANDSSDSFSDGYSSYQHLINPTSGAGTYSINTVSVYDKAGNYTLYEAYQLANMGIATSFEIKSSNSADTTRPLLTSLSFPTVVDVTSGGQYINFTAGASDEGLGVSHIYVNFNKSWQNQSSNQSYFYANDSSDSFSDGYSSYQHLINPTSGAGTYSINTVSIYDKAGNYTLYEAYQLANMGIATSFEIKSSNSADTTRPVLTSLSFPTVVDVTSGGQYINFTAGASDEGLGVSHIYVNFNKSWQNQSSNQSYFYANDSSDSFSDGYSSYQHLINPTSGAGTYSINTVSVYDKAGNYTLYEAYQLADMGIATSFEIADRKVGATAYTNTSGTVSEGSGNSLATTLTLQNISSYSGKVTLAFDAANSTMTASEVNVPAYNGFYSVSKSPAGDYVINLPNIGVVDDLSIEGDETLAFKVTASGQIFSSGSDSSIVTVTVKDNDGAGTAGDDRMDGDAGNNYLLGLSGNDVINGYAGNDWLVGSDGHDQLNGGDGNDRLEPGAGNNIVDGGTGTDTLILTGGRSSYNFIAANGSTYLVGEEGASRIANVENISFAGENIAFESLASSLTAFDGLRYTASYADLLATFGTDAAAATFHYVNRGFADGRDAKGFDGLQYAASYADIGTIFGTNAEAATHHYITSGFAEGRSADSFDGLRYIASHADLINTFGANEETAAVHYITAGRAEGRSVDTFDGLQYAASYADIGATFGTNTQAAAHHYITNGFAEGRSTDSFDGLRYIASHADLINAFGANEETAAVHYITAGRAEGRSLDAFDGLQYAASYADIGTIFGTNAGAATQHYIANGFAEGRSADSFDGLRYIASHADLITAFGSDEETAAVHYITAGRAEERTLDTFDALAYADANPDLSAAYGTDVEALTEHYIDYGFFQHLSTGGGDLFLA